MTAISATAAAASLFAPTFASTVATPCPLPLAVPFVAWMTRPLVFPLRAPFAFATAPKEYFLRDYVSTIIGNLEASGLTGQRSRKGTFFPTKLL